MNVHFSVSFSCSSGQWSGLNHCDIGYRWATTGVPATMGRTDMNDVKTTRSNGTGEIPQEIISGVSEDGY